jgi:hypothetical protein
MTWNTDDLVRVAAGEVIEIEAWGELLQGAGIKYRMVGDNLAAGLGTAFPNAVELWVHHSDAAAAQAAVADRFHNSLDDTLPL